MTALSVCVQGLGFVGAAMAVATARAGHQVIGLDLPTAEGQARVDALNRGDFPMASTDVALVRATCEAFAAGRLRASTDPRVLATVDVVLVDVNLDLAWDVGADASPHANAVPLLAPFVAAIRTIGEYARPGTLVVIESTVPPGTCERVVRPALTAALAERGLPADALLLAHAYERVMPGDAYLASITHYWRVFAGETPAAASRCRALLESIIDTESYPLCELPSMTASETAKVLENSFRATTIALMEEWGRFAEAIGVNLFEVVDAIRQRPTHANIRQPGFGVGGYCLTKDPLMADAAARHLFGIDSLSFPFSQAAVRTNAEAPRTSVTRLAELLDGLDGRRLLLMGVTYRPGVADTRFSPAEAFVREAEARGAQVQLHDPLVAWWPELARTVATTWPSPDVDAVIFAVPHEAYRTLDLGDWVGSAWPLLFDANAVLSPEQIAVCVARDLPLWIVGRGAVTRASG